jgi:hypothetical protein
MIVAENVRALAIHPHPDAPDADVRVIATRPGGEREEMVALRIRSGWTRRYWYRDPVLLPKGTRIDVEANPSRSGGASAPPLPEAPPAPLQRDSVTPLMNKRLAGI